jgi:hypothetical protein
MLVQPNGAGGRSLKFAATNDAFACASTRPQALARLAITSCYGGTIRLRFRMCFKYGAPSLFYVNQSIEVGGYGALNGCLFIFISQILKD